MTRNIKTFVKVPYPLKGEITTHAPTVWSAYGPERGRKPRRKLWESTPEEILAHKDIHSGACCVIANGPSVVEIDLTRITCPTIGLNHAWKLTECDYYCIGDQAQFEAYEKIRGPIETLKPLFATHAGPESAVRIRGLLASTKQFSFDLVKGIYLNNTISSYGIQLAVWMGFDIIYTVGLDLYGQHFYDGAKKTEIKFSNERETHGYFAGLFEGMGGKIKVINLNMDSYCFAYEKQKFEDVF